MFWRIPVLIWLAYSSIIMRLKKPYTKRLPLYAHLKVLKEVVHPLRTAVVIFDTAAVAAAISAPLFAPLSPLPSSSARLVRHLISFNACKDNVPKLLSASLGPKIPGVVVAVLQLLNFWTSFTKSINLIIRHFILNCAKWCPCTYET